MLPVARRGHRVGHWVAVRCVCPTAAEVLGEGIGRGIGLHRPANHQDTSAVAAGTVDTVVDSFQSQDASLAD